MWEDQGRQFHQWFGHGTSGQSGDDASGPAAPKAITIGDAATAVAVKAAALLPAARRAAYTASLAGRGLGELKTAIPLWSGASHLAPAAFRAMMVGNGFRPEGAAQVQALGQALASPLTPEAIDTAARHLAAAISGETAGRWAYALNYARDKANYAAVNELVALVDRPQEPEPPPPPVPALTLPLAAGMAAAAAPAAPAAEWSVPTWMSGRAALGLLSRVGPGVLAGLTILLMPTTVADGTISGHKMPPADPAQGPSGGTATEMYVPAPDNLPGFPGAKRMDPKTPRQGGSGLRKRWRLPDGRIAEWDYQHGEVEVYDKRGEHKGSHDPETGDQTKDPVPGRRVEP